MNIAKAIVAALFLAACGQPATAPQSATATGDQAKPEVSFAGANAPAPAVAPISLVGRWGDNGDCAKDIVFNPDGTFHSYTGGDGMWRLDGDVVTMSGASGTFQVRVEVINNTQLIVHNPDGSVGTSQRC